MDNNLNPENKWNKLKKLLFKYCNKNKKVTTKKIKYKNQNIGTWLQNQKTKIKSNTDDIYIKLSENEYVKKSLDDNLAKKLVKTKKI